MIRLPSFARSIRLVPSPAPGPAPDGATLRRLAKERDWEAIVALTNTVAHATHGPALTEARLARADALRKLGRAQDALAAIEAIVRQARPSSAAQEALAASLSLFGRHEEAREALAAAAALVPPDDRGGRTARRIARLAAEELLHLGRHDAARETMTAALAGAAPGHGEMSLLRRTIRDPYGLERVFSIVSPLFRGADASAPEALFQLSMACRDLGEPALAVSAARQRFLKMIHAVPFGGAGPARVSTGWLAEARVALADLVADLAAAGERPFLVSGTFLGFVREGGIIGHDKDIDLGLLTQSAPETLRRALATTGRFQVRPAVTDRLVQLVHANGVVLDLFLHWRDGDRILHAGQKGCWWNSAFALADADFLGASVLVPEPADGYLDENYGPDWRTPDPEFETFLDTPNIIPPGEDHMLWYFFTKLGDFYRAGKLAKIERVWALLAPKIGRDDAVDAAIEKARAEADRADQ